MTGKAGSFSLICLATSQPLRLPRRRTSVTSAWQVMLPPMKRGRASSPEDTISVAKPASVSTFSKSACKRYSSDGSPVLQAWAWARLWLLRRLLLQSCGALTTNLPLIPSWTSMIGRCPIDLAGPAVVGKLQVVGNVLANGELGQTRDGKGPDDQITDENADLRLRRKGPGKAHSAALLCCDIVPQQRLISAKCLAILPLRSREFTSQDIGGDHSVRRALPRQQRHSEGGVTDLCDATARPPRHSDLAHPIKVELIGSYELGEHVGAFPSAVAVDVAKHYLLFCLCRRQVGISRWKN